MRRSMVLAASLTRHAVLWEKGKMVDLSPPGAASEAVALNDQGLIIGLRYEGLDSHAALWTHKR